MRRFIVLVLRKTSPRFYSFVKYLLNFNSKDSEPQRIPELNVSIELEIENTEIQKIQTRHGFAGPGQLFINSSPLALPGVSVVIPVHDAGTSFLKCVRSLVAFTKKSAEIIVIDDQSSDPLVFKAIEILRESFSSIKVITNIENLGFTNSVNIGLRAADSSSDVILLNSDTEVTARWIEKLQYVAHSNCLVGTVTPVSNNAGVFSVPESSGGNQISSWMSIDDHAKAIEQEGSGVPIDVPTGNGFCMLITAKSRAMVGYFDEESFPRGYGEENDFCMRARSMGFRNLVTTKAFVFHEGSQSFGEEKLALGDIGMKNLLSKHPEYPQLLGVFNDADFTNFRDSIRKRLSDDLRKVRSRILFIQPILDGGTLDANNQLLSSLSKIYECYIMVYRGGKASFFLYDSSDQKMLIEEFQVEDSIEITNLHSPEYDGLLIDFVFRHSIDLVHVEHFAYQSIGWSRYLGYLGVPFVVSTHDYYALCPSLNLLDENLSSCGGICSPGSSQCNVTLFPKDSVPPLKNGYVRNWRRGFETVFANSFCVFAPSNSALKIVLEAYGDRVKRSEVILHGRSRYPLSSPKSMGREFHRLKVLVPGHSALHKGSLLLQEICKHFGDRDDIEFHTLGSSSPDLEDLVFAHGSYEKSEFNQRVRSISPDFALITAISEETFNFSLDECWESGLPVLAIDIGAIGERIKAYGGGWLIKRADSANGMIEKLEWLILNRDILEEMKLEVTGAPHEYLRESSAEKMALRYASIYNDAIGTAKFLI